jgi:hypothetical protein
MNHKDKYRQIAIIAFIAAVLLLVLLFIVLYNNLSVNPEVESSNLIYLLLLLILIATGTMFVGHLLQIHEYHLECPPELEGDKPEQVEVADQPAENETETPTHTYNIDIDQIAELIIPKKNPSEDIAQFTDKILSNLAKHFDAVLGVIYLKEDNKDVLKPLSTYAWASEKAPGSFKIGEGLNGQAAKSKSTMKITDIPGDYMKVTSSLGEGSPGNLLLIPLLLNKDLIGMIELAFFKEIDDEVEWTFKNLGRMIANSIVTRMKAAKEKK